MGSVSVIRDGVGIAHMGHPTAPYLSLQSPEPSDQLRWPVGLSLMEILLVGPSKPCLGRRRVICIRLRLVSCAWVVVVVGPTQAMFHFNQVTFCWVGHVPSVRTCPTACLSVLNRGRERVFVPFLRLSPSAASPPSFLPSPFVRRGGF